GSCAEVGELKTNSIISEHIKLISCGILIGFKWLVSFKLFVFLIDWGKHIKYLHA
ncbi:MAG: hypothetical protein ACJAR4_002648, partial [Psychroserpens sp.]